MNSNEKQIIDLIKRNQKILVLPSSPLDGDSLGSAVGMYLALKKLNKDVTVVCSDSIPEVLKFLPNIGIVGNELSSSKDFIVTLNCSKSKVDTIKSEIEDNKINIIITPKEGTFTEDDVSFKKGESEYDLIITVDCAEFNQLRSLYDNNIELFNRVPIINIDHHISNVYFGKINHIDIMASSASEIILSLLENMASELGQSIMDEDIATLLLAGIITDTGSFQNSNTTPRAFAQAAKLISYGARQQEIIQHVYKTKQLSQLKLWGRILSKIQTDDQAKMVWSVVTQQDFRDTGSNDQEIGDIIDNLMTNAPGAEVIVLFKEKNNKISVSIRTTTPTIDSSKIAENFGGGGHVQAAGFLVQNGDLRDIEFKVIKYIRELQTTRLNIIEETDPIVMNELSEIIKKGKDAEIEIEKEEEKIHEELNKEDKKDTSSVDGIKLKTNKQKEKSSFKTAFPQNFENDKNTTIIYKFEQ